MGFVFQPRRLAQAAALSVLAGSCVALAATPAEAILTFYIFENPANGNNVRLLAEGSLTTPSVAASPASCAVNGAIDFAGSSICAGTQAVDLRNYVTTPIANTNNFLNYSPAVLLTGSTSSIDSPASPFAYLDVFSNQFYISNQYVSGTQISSYSDFVGNFNTLLGPTATTSGTLGTWMIGTGPLDPTNTVIVQFGAPPGPGPGPGSTVPGPLPVLGGAAAFGWSRRLRRRIQA